jgi:hypothetical protein
MIRTALEHFIHDVMASGEIKLSDVRRLQREVIPEGIDTRDEADLLIALDRAITVKHCSWSAAVIQTVVHYAVWTSRPTGYVDRDTSAWLVASLTAGRGPSPVAEAIAFEVVREAEKADPVLLEYVMRSARGRLDVAPLGLAA